MANQRDSALGTFARRRVAGYLWSLHPEQPLLQPGGAAPPPKMERWPR
jgi:hypothetical protein